MPSRIFVITACAASELGFTARLFTALGAPCGHEEIFHTAAFERGGTLLWPPTAAGDASWYAAPVLAKLPESSVVIHQVRHPLATIHDLYVSRFFERDTPSRDFVQDFLPETRLGGPLVRCMRLWLQWHRMIEAAGDYEDLVYRRYRLEDTTEHRACEQLALIGLQRDAGTARRVLSELGGPPVRTQLSLGWDELPDAGLTKELREMASRYGYSVPGASTDSPGLAQPA
ncbi:MAG: hypothetical protein AAGG01_10260 [Planctomycetota bacterium]